MKVLWFSLSPCSSIKRNNLKRYVQGWMISLEEEIKKNKNIKLEIAYLSNERDNNSPFIFDDVTYYPISIASSNFAKKIRNIYGSVESRDAAYTHIMLDIVTRSKPDIIHIHGTEAFFGLISKHIDNIPIVYSIQGLISPYKEKYFSGIPYSEMRKYDSLKKRLRNHNIKKLYLNFTKSSDREKEYLSNAKYVMGRTEWDFNICKLFNPKVNYYIVNEILRNDFYKKQWNKNYFNKKRIIISTISPGIYKGLECLLKASSILKQFASFEFEWHVVGCSEDSEWCKIVKNYTKLNFTENNIIFHGLKDSYELAELIIESDIYCQVSHIENSPNSLCEAMILGIPTIASYAGGTSSLLVHNKEGLLYQDGDPYALASCIVKINEDFNYAKNLGKAANERARKRHNPNSIVTELTNAYTSILEKEKYCDEYL